jgi:hypothetical protein
MGVGTIINCCSLLHYMMVHSLQTRRAAPEQGSVLNNPIAIANRPIGSWQSG